MPYSASHKAKVRQSIIAGAARSFRQKGLDGVSVPQLMQQAGLTHGGFYAHFESKEDLIGEAVRQGLQESRQKFIEASDGGLEALIGRYVSRSHRDHPEAGCVLPALSGEIARHSPEVREGFSQMLAEFVAALEPLLPSPKQAIPLAASMVGAVMLARAVSDPKFSDQIIQSCRTQLSELFGGTHDT